MIPKSFFVPRAALIVTVLTLPSAAAARPLGYLSPRQSAAISGSMWGIQAGTLQSNILNRAADLGVKWTRLWAEWPEIEKEKGQYDFSATDEAFAAVLNRGITPFVTLDRGHPLYSEPVPHPDPNWRLIYGTKPGPPILKIEATAAWLSFVEATVRRYRDRVKHWEIWNEPNHYAYWGAPPNASDYGRLVRLTSERIKAIDPGAVIIAGATAGLLPDYIEGFLKEDTNRLVDVVSFHNYANTPEARMYFADETWKVLRVHNPRLVLWQGECGYPSASSTDGFRGTSP